MVLVPRLQVFAKISIVFVWIINICCKNVDAFAKPSLVMGRSKYGSIGSAYGLGPEPMAPMSGMPELSITQRQDNFDPSNTNTFQNMYYVNDAFYKPGGPIFLMFRGESAASISFMVAGAWIKYAEQYGAKLYQLEHRFYGKSIPTPDLSTENLRFLSVEQAMADAANFIKQMNAQNNYDPEETKWILFGGSYAGAMSVWFRVRYPGLTHGSISSSGPINPVVNYAEYYEAVSGAIGDHSPQCADAINSAFLDLWPMMNDPSGELQVSDNFKLCSNLSSSSIQDKINLQFALSSSFASIVQYNNDNIGANMMNIKTICSVMGNSAYGTPIEQLASYVSLYLTNNGENCEGYRYQGTVASLSQYTISSAAVVSGDRQWFWQTCSELGYFQTSDDPYEVFGQGFSTKFFWQECSDVFGPSLNQLKKIVLNYGGYCPPTDNVLCLQGSLDPWRKLGYTRNTTKGVMAFYIEGTAHVADMYEPSPTDPPSLTAARLVTSAYIGELLNREPTYYKSPVFIVPNDSSAISDSSNNPGVKAPHYNLNQTLAAFHSQNSTFIDPNFVGASVEAGVSKIMRFSKSPELPTIKGQPGRRGRPRRPHKHHKAQKDHARDKKDAKNHKKGGKKHHKQAKPEASSVNSSSSSSAPSSSSSPPGKKQTKGKKKHHPKRHYHPRKHFEPSRTSNTRSFANPSTKNSAGSMSVPTASSVKSLHNSDPMSKSRRESFMGSMKPFKSLSLKNLNKSPVMANTTSTAQPMTSTQGQPAVAGSGPAVPQQNGNPSNATMANAPNSQNNGPASNPPPPPPRAHRKPAPRHRPHGRSRRHRHLHHHSPASSSNQSNNKPSPKKVHHKKHHKKGGKHKAPRRPKRLRHPPRFPGDSGSSSSPSSSNSGKSGSGSSSPSSTSSTTSATKATSSGSSSSTT